MVLSQLLFNEDKWFDKKDAQKSSIPLLMVPKSRRALPQLGLEIEKVPSVDEIIEQCAVADGKEELLAGATLTLIQYLRDASDKFYAKETHKSNNLG